MGIIKFGGDLMGVFQGIYTMKERNDLIKKEYRRLEKGLKDLDESKQITLKKLINDAAFMGITLEEARLIIIRDGIIEEYQNGANQYGVKKSAAVEVYDKMVNTYAKVVDQINKAMPEGKGIDASEEIMKYAFGGKR